MTSRSAVVLPLTNIFLLIFGSTACQQIGIDMGILALKAISVILLLCAYVLGVSLLTKIWRSVVVPRTALTLFILLGGYPLGRTIYDVATDFSLRNAIDGFYIMGSYYTLPLLGLVCAYCVLLGDINKTMLRFGLLGLPLALLMMYEGYYSQTPQFYAQIIIDNYFIPLVFGLLVSGWKRVNYVGVVGLIGIGTVAAVVGSRSYMLVFGLFVLGYLLLFRRSRANLIGLASSVAALLIGGYLTNKISNTDSIVAFHSGQTIKDKFMLQSLFDAVGTTVRDGDFTALLYWEGNSRSDIIRQAFMHVTTGDLYVGGGVFKTYEVDFGGHLVQRSVIEVGWAQEIFRWGWVYFGVLMGTLFYAFYYLRRRAALFGDIGVAFAILLLVRFLDSWIFGLATNTNYSMLFCAGIMLLALDERAVETQLMLMRDPRIKERTNARHRIMS